jgi:4-hydroxybenzoate polyprenyltransferase
MREAHDIAAVERRGGRLRPLVRVLRLEQWSKNLLVFVAPFLGHRLQADVLGRAALAFLAFGLVASATYVLNDLADAGADRQHARKRHRPIASGAVSTRAAWTIAPVLLAAGVALAFLLPPSFRILLLAYFLATVSYSAWLKRVVFADVLVLAAFYTARLFAGSFATGVPVSEWLATFSLFLFLSLALMKRASEILATPGDIVGRGYRKDDHDVVLAMGTGSAYLSVLVLALYVSSADVRRLYAHPQWLWALCPLVLYWTSRLWIRARRGLVHGDPLAAAIADPVTWGVAAVGAAVILAAR